MDDDKKKQVLEQCKAVSHMAKSIGEVYEHYSQYLDDKIVESVGHRTARLMETLGDILNGMDAVDDGEDEWMDPIFEKAHLMFPQPKE